VVLGARVARFALEASKMGVFCSVAPDASAFSTHYGGLESRFTFRRIQGSAWPGRCRIWPQNCGGEPVVIKGGRGI
jgi:hypothetical protein